MTVCVYVSDRRTVYAQCVLYQPRQTDHFIGYYTPADAKAKAFGTTNFLVDRPATTASTASRSRFAGLRRRIVMRIATVAFLVLVSEALAGGVGGKHHVHFKIHVPDIIKHHIHTKTVFIHVHAGGHGGGKKKMIPKKKETHHEESHHEDWSSWSSYDTHGGHGAGHEHHGTKGVKSPGKGPVHVTMPHYTHGGHSQGYTHGYDDGSIPHRNLHSQMLAYDPGQLFNTQNMQNILHSQYMIGDHPVPPKNPLNQHGVIGYSYPPQYGVQQELQGEFKAVKEAPHNDIEPYSEVYEEGYRKGHHSQTGHLLSKDLNNFYDNNFEEGDFSHNGHDDQAYDKYKTHDDSKSDDTTGGDHDGYDYHGGDSYLSSIMDTR